MIRVVSFDIGGTLLMTPKCDSVRQLLEKNMRVDSLKFNNAYKKHFIEKVISLEEFCEIVCCPYPNKIIKAIKRYYEEKPKGILFGEVLEIISELKKRNMFLVTVSNKSYLNPFCLEDYSIGDYFNAEIYSFQVNSAKPDVKIFIEAQNLANTIPKEIIHVGNSIKSDVIGAKAIGWHTILIQREKKIMSDCDMKNVLPDYLIANLKEIFSIIDTL